jgi:hypothetical protein
LHAMQALSQLSYGPLTIEHDLYRKTGSHFSGSCSPRASTARGQKP